MVHSPIRMGGANMATSAEYASPRFSPSSSVSAARSPDTASPIYPDRAIRPLPKSRLKSKLSPEQATNIIYPPDPPPISPTLNFSNVQEQQGIQHARQVNGDAHGPHHAHVPLHEHCTCGEDGDSGDEEVEFDHPDFRYAAAVSPLANGAKPQESVQRRLLEASRVPVKPPPPGSTASSADGYESFENTSNKKKRKIPLSSASSMHHSSLSAEMASMGISTGDGGLDQDGPGHHSNGLAPSSSPSGTGISGAGRGRYGRPLNKHERRPLTMSVNAVNGYNARLPRAHQDGKTFDNGIENAGGIISQAIKTAAEKGPLPANSKDNISLLQSAAHSNAAKTQFTFACESESASRMADQQAASAAAAHASSARVAAPQPAQHSPRPRQVPMPHASRPPLPPSTHPSGQTTVPPPPPPAAAPRPKPRRRLSREYGLAARQRQMQQEYNNYHHPPAKGEMYICEFCEYEDIFGEPPAAMIRRYEIKDREERKKAAERRRLLEKAKMKNRKGKKGKGGKNNSSGATPVSPNRGAGSYDPDLPPGAEGEEYYDDEEFGDEYDPANGDQYDEALHDPAYYPSPSSRSGIQPPATTPATVAGSTGRPPPIPSN